MILSGGEHPRHLSERIAWYSEVAEKSGIAAVASRPRNDIFLLSCFVSGFVRSRSTWPVGSVHGRPDQQRVQVAIDIVQHQRLRFEIRVYAVVLEQ